MKKSNRCFKLNGKQINLAEECKKRGLNYCSIWQRIHQGQSVEEALSKPTGKRRTFKYGKMNDSLEELCKKHNWDRTYIRARMYTDKLTFEQAVKDCIKHKKTYGSASKRLSKFNVDLKKVRELCETRGLRFSMVYSRLQSGKSLEEALRPKTEKLFGTINITDECRKRGISRAAVYKKLALGESIQEALIRKRPLLKHYKLKAIS